MQHQLARASIFLILPVETFTLKIWWGPNLKIKCRQTIFCGRKVLVTRSVKATGVFSQFWGKFVTLKKNYRYTVTFSLASWRCKSLDWTPTILFCLITDAGIFFFSSTQFDVGAAKASCAFHVNSGQHWKKQSLDCCNPFFGQVNKFLWSRDLVFAQQLHRTNNTNTNVSLPKAFVAAWTYWSELARCNVKARWRYS